jgi:hypothetical protein
VEGLWASLKGWSWPTWLATPLQEVTAAAEQGVEPIQGTLHLAFSFLRVAACPCGERDPVTGRGDLR